MGSRIRVLLPLALFVFGACQAAQTVREEAAPPAADVSEDLTMRYVRQIVEDFRVGYLDRDVQGFMKHVSDGFYRGRARFQESVEREFAAAAESSLDVEILEVEEEDQKVSVSVRWTLGGDGEPGPAAGGTTILIFHRTDTISLVDLRQDPFFGMNLF